MNVESGFFMNGDLLRREGGKPQRRSGMHGDHHAVPFVKNLCVRCG
jgi:hypothetical protein